jgi:hypothetical protein
MGRNQGHFTAIRKINFGSTRQFSTTIPLISKERGGSSIERKGVKQFSTTKPLKPIILNDEFKIIVNSLACGENRLNFVNNQSILLLPSYINNYIEFIWKFKIICSKLNKEEYKFRLKFYFDVKFNSEATDLPWPGINIVYLRISAKEFVHINKLTGGYVEVCSAKLYSEILYELDYFINKISPNVDINRSSEVLLIIEAEKKPKPALPADMMKVIYYEPGRAVAAYGSSVTKGSSASYKIYSTACTSWGAGQVVRNKFAGDPLSKKEIFTHKSDRIDLSSTTLLSICKVSGHDPEILDEMKKTYKTSLRSIQRNFSTLTKKHQERSYSLISSVKNNRRWLSSPPFFVTKLTPIASSPDKIKFNEKNIAVLYLPPFQEILDIVKSHGDLTSDDNTKLLISNITNAEFYKELYKTFYYLESGNYSVNFCFYTIKFSINPDTFFFDVDLNDNLTIMDLNHKNMGYAIWWTIIVNKRNNKYNLHPIIIYKYCF